MSKYKNSLPNNLLANLSTLYSTSFLTVYPSHEIDLRKAVNNPVGLTYYDVGKECREVRARQLYKELGYSTFDEYCKKRWNISGSYGYRLIKSSQVIENVANWQQNNREKSVSNWRENLPTSERQTRELAKLPADKQGLAGKKSVQRGEGQVRAKDVKAVVEEMLEPETPINSSCQGNQILQILELFESIFVK